MMRMIFLLLAMTACAPVITGQFNEIGPFPEIDTGALSHDFVEGLCAYTPNQTGGADCR